MSDWGGLGWSRQQRIVQSAVATRRRVRSPRDGPAPWHFDEHPPMAQTGHPGLARPVDFLKAPFTLSLTRGRSRQLTAPFAVRACRRSTQSRTVTNWEAISARSTVSLRLRSALSRSFWLLLQSPVATDDFGYEVSEPQLLISCTDPCGSHSFRRAKRSKLRDLRKRRSRCRTATPFFDPTGLVGALKLAGSSNQCVSVRVVPSFYR